MGNEVNYFGINKLFEGNDENCQLDVVFIHGLNGHAFETWKNTKEEIWLHWLFDEFDDISVWTIGYDATSTAWKSDAMPMSQRGLNLLEKLNTTDNIGTRPLIFVVHSMGGLILKYILELSQQNKKYHNIINNTKSIVFLATPHTGSIGATFLKGLNIIYRANYIVKELSKGNPELNRLENSFCSLVKEKDLKCFSFYETKEVRLPEKKFWFTDKKIPFINTKGLKIVSEESARGSFTQDPPIPLDKDHINICKIESKDDLIFKKVKEFISDILSKNENSSKDEIITQISNSFEDTEEKKKSISRIFLIFTEDNITNDKYKVTGYIQDNDEYASNLIEFTFENIHNEEEQEKFLEILLKESELDNVPVHFILPASLFLINFKQWKYKGTELINIYHVLFHYKDRFSRKISKYNSMKENWDDKFSKLKNKRINESLLSISNKTKPFDNRDKLGAYFSYQPDVYDEIERIVDLANIVIWKYSREEVSNYEQWLASSITLGNINKESRKCNDLALLWDEMSLLENLRGKIE